MKQRASACFDYKGKLKAVLLWLVSTACKCKDYCHENVEKIEVKTRLVQNTTILPSEVENEHAIISSSRVSKVWGHYRIGNPFSILPSSHLKLIINMQEIFLPIH